MNQYNEWPRYYLIRIAFAPARKYQSKYRHEDLSVKKPVPVMLGRNRCRLTGLDPRRYPLVIPAENTKGKDIHYGWNSIDNGQC